MSGLEQVGAAGGKTGRAGTAGACIAFVLAAAWTVWLGGLEGGGKPWALFAPWHGGTTAKALVAVLAVAAGLRLAGKRGAKWFPRLLLAGFAASQCVLAWSAWTVARKVPWGFDHPSFMFRVWEFGKVFPGALGGYLPFWNGGVEHFVGVTSGAHAIGVVLWPLLQWMEPHVFYGAALVAWFTVVLPWLSALSVRGAGAGWGGAACAGMLACGATREFFLWMWHYGTAGAMTSAMLVLPVYALGWRLASGRGGWGTAAALGVAAWVMCLWTPGIFAAAGLALGWLADWPLWTRKKWACFVAAGAGALALLSPWLWTTLGPCRNVVEYVGTELARPALPEILKNGALRLKTAAEEVHPLVLALGLGGALWACPAGLRRWTLPGAALLAGLAGWSQEFKPLSQMARMCIPMAMVLALPAAWVCGMAADGLQEAGIPGRAGWRRWGTWLSCGVLAAGLAFGARAARMFYLNQQAAKQRSYANSGMPAWVEWVRENVPEEGRLAFAGKAVHAYGGGNIAYLPVLTGREMMADDYYGFPRNTIEYDYPPRFYRATPEGWDFFGRAYGITHWAAAKPREIRFLESHPELFTHAASLEIGSYAVEIFEANAWRGVPATRFLEGRGRVEARENELVVRPEPGQERVVLRYNWREGLECATAGAEIGPFAVDGNLRFVEVRPGGADFVRIRYRAHAAPVEPNYDGRFHH